MRFESIFLGWFALAPLLSVACSKDKAGGQNAEQTAEINASAAASATVEVAPASVHARLGGKVIAVGSYLTELLVHADGEVKALLMESDGKLTSSPGDAALSLQMAEVGGTEATIKLAWDPIRASFTGHARAGAKLMAGPAKVELAFQGKTMNARLALMPVVTGPRFGGQLLVVGDLGAELLLSARGLVQAFVMDASGKADASGNLDVSLIVPNQPALTLKWEPPCACYQAHLTGGLDLSKTPVELSLASGGRLHVGGLAALKASADADLAARAKLEAEPAAAVRGNGNASLKIESPSIHVTPPKLNAHASASLGAQSGANANANAKAGVKAPSISIKPPSVSAKAGAKAGVKLGF